MKSEKKRSKKSLAVVLTVIMVLSVCAAGIVPVSANVASVTRELPDTVEPNEEFVVTVTQSGFFLESGWVTETLPEDFVYVEESFTGAGIEDVTYNESTRKLKFPFRDETSVAYSVTASSYEQIAEFSGRYGAWVEGGGFEKGDVGGDPIVAVDETPPYTTGHAPAPDATGVPIDTNIVVHVKDNSSGVDFTTIEMTVNGAPVTPVIAPIGLALNFSVTYNPSGDFDYGEEVEVTIDASDLAGYAMTTDSYSFTTEGEGDTEPPVITNVSSLSITTDSATIAWNTDENSDSLVKYGTASGVYTMEKDDAIDVTAHSIDLTGLSADTTYYYVVNSTDPSGNSAESGEYSFTTEAEEKPDLIVTAISPNCGYLFANESNNISATIKNNGTAIAGAFNVRFAVDGYSEEVRIAGLTAGASEEVTVTDTTIRNAGASVTITVIADCDGEVSESNEENNETVQAETVVNNGYKGKRYTGGEDINTLQTHTLNGSVLYSTGDSYYLSGYSTAWTTYTANWTAGDLPVPGDATIEKARLYVTYTWDKVQGMPDNVSLTFNDNLKTRDAFYTDRKGYGSSDYPYGMLAYDVTGDFNTGSINTAVLENLNPVAGNPSIRGMLLVVIYADDSEPLRKIIVNEGFDLLYGGSGKCTTPEEATAYAPFAGAIEDIANKSARLITVAPGADPNEGELIFNGHVWNDVWNFAGTGSPTPQIGIDDRDVTTYLQSTENEAGFRSSADYMEASNAILVVEYAPTATGSIAGKITYTCNTTGIAGVDVNLTKAILDGGIEVVKSTTTNDTGYYNFTDVAPNGYFVNASKPRFWDNSTDVTVSADATATADMMLWLKGDLNNNGLSADIGDVAMMWSAWKDEITADYRYNLNSNEILADIGDVAMMWSAWKGEIVLEDC